jgi:hypothetical protein
MVALVCFLLILAEIDLMAAELDEPRLVGLLEEWLRIMRHGEPPVG